MSHASSKRSRQEPGHRVDHHPRNHNILEDNEDLVVAKMPKKGMNVNAETERDEEAHERELVNKFARLPYILAYDEPGYFYASEIKLHNLEYATNNVVTLDYDETYLKVVSAEFSASVTVQVPPIPRGNKYEVGCIVVCTDLQHLHVYGQDGINTTEIPELVSGKYSMINAGAGPIVPWYSNRVEGISGPTFFPTFIPIYLNVQLSSKVAWTKASNDPNLTYVFRKQDFYAFFVLKDVNTNIFQIIEALTWSADYAIDVNPKEPLEERAKLLIPHDQEIPRIVPVYLTPPLDDKALKSPRAKDCNVRIWWSQESANPQIFQGSSHTREPLNASLIRTKKATFELVRQSLLKYS